MSEELEAVDLGAVEKVNFDSPKGVSEGVDLSAVKSVDFGPPEDVLAEVLEVLRETLPPVLTREQLVYLGRENLMYARGVLKEMLAKARTVRKKQWKMLTLLDGRSVTKLQKIAKRYYDNPQYEACQSKWKYEKIMPVSDKAKNRRAGSTTLNICGWCRFAVPFDVPYGKTGIPGEQRVFRPCCGFCSDEWSEKREKAFNSPCILTQSQEQTDEICEQLRDRHWQYMSYYHKLVQYIDYLDGLIAEAESKPLFPQYRSLFHYPVGTPMYYFRRDYETKREVPSHPFGYQMMRPVYEICQGKVVGHVERRYVQDAVEIQIEGVPEPTKFTYTSGDLVSFEELAYLAEHDDYARVWLEAQEHPSPRLMDALVYYQKQRYFSERVQ